MGVKATRQAIMQALADRYGTTFKTYLSGYPFYEQVEITPYLAVFSENETITWAGNRRYSREYDIQIEIGIDARAEIERRNRGRYNEDWLNDMAEEITQLFFSELHTIDTAHLQSGIGVAYRTGGGGLIRTMTINLRYKEDETF